MNRKRDALEPRPRRSPMETVKDATDDLFAELRIPGLPENVPERLQDGLRTRIEALLFHLRECKRNRFVAALELRVVREAQSAVLTACELNIRDCRVYFATLRELLEELGYERTEAGFRRLPREEEK
jgi:hypothetical protein